MLRAHESTNAELLDHIERMLMHAITVEGCRGYALGALWSLDALRMRLDGIAEEPALPRTRRTKRSPGRASVLAT